MGLRYNTPTKMKTKRKTERNSATSQSGQELARYPAGFPAGFKAVATSIFSNCPVNPATYPAKNWPDIRPDSPEQFPTNFFFFSDQIPLSFKSPPDTSKVYIDPWNVHSLTNTRKKHE